MRYPEDHAYTYPMPGEGDAARRAAQPSAGREVDVVNAPVAAVADRTAAPVGEPSAKEVLALVLAASEALRELSIRSLAGLGHEVTLAQFRVLSELSQRGATRLADLAALLAVEPPTATRMCDRLVRKGVVCRRASERDRRVVLVDLTPLGRQLVEQVAERRRSGIEAILTRLPYLDRRPLARAIEAFVEASGARSAGGRSGEWRLLR